MNQMLNILVVDDDAEIRALLEGLLQRNAMKPVSARSAAEARDILEQKRFDLILLDLMMPGEDGLAFCRSLREHSTVPVIMLTALNEDIDRILGLEIGADDYLPKPFHPRELLARIKSVLRRAPNVKPGESDAPVSDFEFGPYRVDVERRQVETEDGTAVDLTSGEFALLLTLLERAPRVLSRDQLLEFSRRAASNPFDRRIDSQISRLRRKLEENPRRPEYIKTVRSLGYAFAGRVRRVGSA
ncbi:MAG: response regulator [Pseudomonadota bacterium]